MTGLQSVLQICICKATQIFRYRQAFSAIFQKCFFFSSDRNGSSNASLYECGFSWAF